MLRLRIYNAYEKGLITEDEKYLFLEASHGKLKYDFRAGVDANTGHALKIVYSLDNINIDNTPKFPNDKNEIQKNIARKGNGDHQSHGQKVVAIIDRVTNKKLNEADVIGTYGTGVTPSLLEQNNMDYIKEKNKDKISHVKVGSVDNASTFKSTHWFKNDTVDKKIKVRGGNITYKADNSVERRNAMENIKHGRGAKMNDLKGELFVGSSYKPTYNHPSKKDIKKNPEKYKDESEDK